MKASLKDPAEGFAPYQIVIDVSTKKEHDAIFAVACATAESFKVGYIEEDNEEAVNDFLDAVYGVVIERD